MSDTAEASQHYVKELQHQVETLSARLQDQQSTQDLLHQIEALTSQLGTCQAARDVFQTMVEELEAKLMAREKFLET